MPSTDSVIERLGTRSIEPEWLDLLPPDDPRAVRSRRDLKRINVWMRHVQVMRRLLLETCGETPPRSILDLGAGDGTLLLRLAKHLAPRWPPLAAVLVDRLDVVDERTVAELRSLGWDVRLVVADALEYLCRPDAACVDVVLANLFLHHLDRHSLELLFARMSALTSVLVACEPSRTPAALAASRLLLAIGCNDVSRHDARVSVRAGFSGDELSSLWPPGAGWRLAEGGAGLFTHSFVAHRTDGWGRPE